MTVNRTVPRPRSLVKDYMAVISPASMAWLPRCVEDLCVAVVRGTARLEAVVVIPCEAVEDIMVAPGARRPMVSMGEEGRVEV